MIGLWVILALYGVAWALYHRNAQRNPNYESPVWQDEREYRERVYADWQEAGYVPVREGNKIVAKRPSRSLAWPAPKPTDRKG